MSVVNTSWIIARAQVQGFPLAGIAAVEPMDPSPIQRWLEAGYGAEMSYLQRHAPLRANLPKLLPGARSVICVALPYPGTPSDASPIGIIAKYACGADYHSNIHARLAALWQQVKAICPSAEGRIFVDSGPLPERELARRAGLGWVGEHSCLVHPEFGSRFCLGEILTDLSLSPTAPISEGCRKCQACRLACPTGALVAPGIVDARRCLSYLTIEHKGPIPRALRPLLGTRLFGCDSCQDACPYNRHLGAIAAPLQSAVDLLTLTPQTLLSLSPREFNARFRETPLARAKRRGVLRNACVVLGNRRDSQALPILRHCLGDPEPLIRAHAAWALGQLGGAVAAMQAALCIEEEAWVREEIELALACSPAE